MKRSGIYLIEHRYTGRVYVGSTLDLDHRYFSHFSHLRRGNHPNHKLQADFTQDGEAAFSYQVIEECSADELAIREIYWIARLGSAATGYNLTNSAIRHRPPHVTNPSTVTTAVRLTDAELAMWKKLARELECSQRQAFTTYLHTEAARRGWQ